MGAMAEKRNEKKTGHAEENEPIVSYYIQFRPEGQRFTASSFLLNLRRDDVVMVKTDHSLEPAVVIASVPAGDEIQYSCKATYELARRASNEEIERYQSLKLQEKSAQQICNTFIEKQKLIMNLVRVERFFNGSKIIFYFTADNRVDFRALVKDLVQEFRTRVEMRQVGVRHETKMIGGLGTCGRELCCSSYMKNFDSVSIKMAKEQDLPLNPSKISGVCNRLLCCLTYEYDVYKKLRKGMPKPGRRIRIGEEEYKVKRQNPLQRSLLVNNTDGEELLLFDEDWQGYDLVRKEKKGKRRSGEKTLI